MREPRTQLLALLIVALLSTAALAQNAAGQNEKPAAEISARGHVAAFANNVIALTGDGDVFTWGGGSGKIPMKVSGLGPSTAVAVGEDQYLALSRDGKVWAWGGGGSGELGTGTALGSATPLRVKDLTNVISIAAGGDEVAGGFVPAGQIPGNVQKGETFAGFVTAISAGNSLALKDDGTVWSWGLNNRGQLGTGSSDPASAVPVQVRGLSGVTAIAEGRRHCVALASDGTVWCWGDNRYGELGDGSGKESSSAPLQAKNITDVVAVAAGGLQTVALKKDGTVWVWGKMFALKKEGTGWVEDEEQKNIPDCVQGLDGVIAVASGYDHFLALRKDHTVWSWGNPNGEALGRDGDFSKPSQIKGPTDAVAIAAGGGVSFATTKDGKVWAWGFNLVGELGTGASEDRCPIAATVKNLSVNVP
jgi:alpha-tubulin suppressor-like RCC1 family protein